MIMKKGRFTKEKFGFSQPAHAPLYARPPIYYKNVEAISLDYETDEEAALDQLPEGLELSVPVLATLMLIRYPFSTLGAYEEAILGIHCTWQGEEQFYIPHIVVNNDVPLAAGREIWGFPKKMARITLEKEADLIWGNVERPLGQHNLHGGSETGETGRTGSARNGIMVRLFEDYSKRRERRGAIRGRVNYGLFQGNLSWRLAGAGLD